MTGRGRGGRPWTPAGVGISLVAGFAAHSLALAVAGAATAVVLGRLRRRHEARVSGRRATADWIDLLDALVAGLTAGLAPPLALRSALPTGPCALDPLPRQLRLALDLQGRPGDALRAAGLVGRRLAASWELALDLGSPLATAVEALCTEVEHELAAADELDAATAGARASVRVLAWLAPAGLALATLAGLAPIPVLLHSELGGLCLDAGVLLDLAGLEVGERLVSAAVRRR